MSDWAGMITQIDAVLAATVPAAHANGLYYPEEAVSVITKAQQGLPFLLWSFDLEVEGDDDEFGPVRILIVDRRLEGAAGALARIQQSQALQAALRPLLWTSSGGGYVMGKPKVETGNGLQVNLELQAAGQVGVWAYGVTAQVRI